MSQLTGGHQLCPVDLATVICQVLAPSRAVAGSYDQLAQLWPPRRPFLHLYYVNIDVFYSLAGRRTISTPTSLPHLTTAAGNHTYAYCISRSWAKGTLPWRSVDVSITNMEPPLQLYMFTLTSSYCFGVIEAIGPGFSIMLLHPDCRWM
jgi:hypothetical protein